jgi:hypothetical protein
MSIGPTSTKNQQANNQIFQKVYEMKKKYSAVESENGSMIIPNGIGSGMQSPETRNQSNSNSVLSGSGAYP